MKNLAQYIYFSVLRLDIAPCTRLSLSLCLHAYHYSNIMQVNKLYGIHLQEM